MAAWGISPWGFTPWSAVALVPPDLPVIRLRVTIQDTIVVRALFVDL